MSTPDTSDPVGRRGYHHGNLREALIAAARQLSAEKGPHGFTMAEAARAAGVSPSAPYRHFKDRDALMAELCRRGFEEFAERLGSAFRAAADAKDGLSRMGRAYLAFAREDPGTYAAMFSYRPQRPREASGAPERASAFDPLVQAIAGLLPEGQRQGRNSWLVALEVWALSHGVAGLERAGLPGPDSGAPPAELVLDDAVWRLLRGA